MKKYLSKIILFALLFGVIVSLVPKVQPEENSQTNDIELIFYSSYNNQSLDPNKLNNINRDFFLPLDQGGYQLDYEIISKSLRISTETEFISLRTSDGFVEIEVYRASIDKEPGIWKQSIDFKIVVSAKSISQIKTLNFTGQVVASMPDDFIGGTIFTAIKYSSMFLEGTYKTISLSLIGTILGFIIALFLASMKLLETNIRDKTFFRIIKLSLNKIASLYITIFRGTPMIVQASFFWYGFGLFGNPLACGLFVVSINTAAYIAEIIRGGIQSIDKGQNEASYSLGMSHFQTMLYVIIPQAIKNSLPAIGNEFIVNIKDTAVLSVIGIFELFNQGRKITGMHYRQLETYLIVALIYLSLTYSISFVLRKVEIKMGLKPLQITSSN